MSRYLPAYAATALVMIALDLLWLGLIAKPLHQNGIGHLMTDRPNLMATGAFYALYAIGLMVFAVVPHLGEAPLAQRCGQRRTVRVVCLRHLRPE